MARVAVSRRYAGNLTPQDIRAVQWLGAITGVQVVAAGITNRRRPSMAASAAKRQDANRKRSRKIDN